MIKSFSHQDIENWAEFTGDRNPVHFDRHTAHQLGLNDIIVQGMLTLLEAKQQLASKIVASSSLTISIKKPIYVNTDVLYECKQNAHKTFLTVSTQENAQLSKCITATLIEQEQPILEIAQQQIQYPIYLYQKKLQFLQRLYPQVTDNWLVIDTLLFAASFEQKKDHFFQNRAKKISTEYDPNKIVTYQVDQKLFIEKSMLSSSPIDLTQLRCSVIEKDVITNNDAVYSVLESQVFHHNQLIYQSSLGFLTQVSRY